MEFEPTKLIINDKEYEVRILKKRMRSMNLRLNDDGYHIDVHIPYFVTKRQALEFVKSRCPSYLRRIEPIRETKKNENRYLFGELSDKEFDELTLKRLLLEYVTIRQRELEEIMGVPPYKIKVRTMSSKYGVNSLKSNSITYTTSLVHYSKEIIDTVIVHELAHYYQRNHQKAFYNIVYRYSPNYKELQKKLKKGIYR